MRRSGPWAWCGRILHLRSRFWSSTISLYSWQPKSVEACLIDVSCIRAATALATWALNIIQWLVAISDVVTSLASTPSACYAQLSKLANLCKVIWSISCSVSALLCIQRMAPTIKLSLMPLASQCHSWSRQSSNLKRVPPCRYHIMCQSSIRSHFLPVPILVMTGASLIRKESSTTCNVTVCTWGSSDCRTHCCTIFTCYLFVYFCTWNRQTRQIMTKIVKLCE